MFIFILVIVLGALYSDVCNEICELGPGEQMHKGQHLWPILIAVAATYIRESGTTQNTTSCSVVKHSL
jgi:hypothetical protein